MSDSDSTGGNTGRITRPGHVNTAAADIDELGPGKRIRDYVISEVISSGGFGTVYRVEHTMLGREAALKVLHAELATSKELVLRFEREARAVNLIRNPNVVDIYDFGQLPDGRPYFVMELLPGMDLNSHLQKNGPRTPGEALAILDPLCGALAAAHAKGIIHRDVKAANVFMSERDGRPRVVLLDFGVAKLLDTTATEITSTNRGAIGTPSSMAPEQIVGGEIDARTDVYALGALAYHMLTGSVVFGSESSTMIDYLHLHARRPRVSALVAVAPALDEVVVRALSIAPDDRHPGAAEFLAAFAAAVATP